MIKVIQDWFSQYFSDPEAVVLSILLLLGFGIVLIMGDILAPVIGSIIIVYILQWWVVLLQNYNLSRSASYLLVYLVFLSVFAIGILFILPLIWKQCISLFSELPVILQNAKLTVLEFIDKYPYLSEQQIDVLSSTLMQDIQIWGKKALSASLSSIPGVIAWFIYIILLPLLVFFFMKDQEKILKWFSIFLPKQRSLLSKVWAEMDEQIGNYIRGKLAEIAVVGFVTYMVFLYFGLHYQTLLAVLVGFSVIIPYVGAVIVTIPVAFAGYIQWGLSVDFTYMFITYLVVQILDGNILVPLLFSEAINIHPAAIIIAILIFGSIWGFWGVFFAIPLATLIKAVLYAWPKRQLVV